jgi:hypothetical protein
MPKRTRTTNRSGNKTSKQLVELLEDNIKTTQSNNDQLIANNDELSQKIGALTNFLIRDRVLRERESNPDKAALEQIRKERRAIRKRIDTLTEQKKKDVMMADLPKPAAPSSKKSFKELSEESYTSGNFISGLFLEMFARNNKEEPVDLRQEKVVRERKFREDLLDELSNKELLLKEKSEELKKAIATNNKTTPTANPNRTITPELSEDFIQAQKNEFYDDRDDEDSTKVNRPTQARIVDIDRKALTQIEGAFSKIKIEAPKNSNAGGGMFDMIPGGLATGGVISKGMRLAGKVALPATIAYGVYNFVSGMSDASVRKNIERRVEKITNSDRVKSGLGEAFSNLTFGLLGDSVSATRFIDSSIGKLSSKIEPFFGDLSPIKTLEEYFASGSLEGALKKLEETLFFWVSKEKPENVGKKLPPNSEIGIRRVPPTPVSVSEIIDQKFTDKDLADSIKKFVMTESSGRKGIINNIGAAGLYQFIQSTAIEQARKTGRQDILDALKDKNIVDFTKDKTIQTLKKQKKFNEIPEYIQKTYPTSVAAAVANLSEEQQTAMFEEYIKPLLEFKKDADFADIKAFGFAPTKYLNALKKNDMDMAIYKKTDRSDPFGENDQFKIWDSNKDNVLTAQELVDGIRASYEGKPTDTSKLDQKETKAPTPVSTPMATMKPFLRFVNPDLNMVTQNDREFNKLSPTNSKLWDEIDREFKVEMAAGTQQKNDAGRVLYPIERLRIRHMYESITGESSSTNGLSYKDLNDAIKAKRPQPEMIREDEPIRKSAIVNSEEIAKEKRMLENASGSNTIIHAPTTTTVMAGSSNEKYTENRERVKDVFNPYSRTLDRLWGVAG